MRSNHSSHIYSHTSICLDEKKKKTVKKGNSFSTDSENIFMLPAENVRCKYRIRCCFSDEDFVICFVFMCRDDTITICYREFATWQMYPMASLIATPPECMSNRYIYWKFLVRQSVESREREKKNGHGIFTCLGSENRNSSSSPISKG